MDDYDSYNTLGIVTRDTGDYDAVPPHVRITGRPQTVRTKKQWGGTTAITILTDEDVAAIRRAAADGRSISAIKKEYGLSTTRTQRIIDGEGATPKRIKQ